MNKAAVRGAEIDRWKSDEVQSVMERLQRHFDALIGNSLVRRQRDAFKNYYAPFQFVLPILQALYRCIEGPGAADEVLNAKERLQPQQPIRLVANNPDSREMALSKRRLRAIAYFSWEEEGRLFLVRRVYPTYFDFLAISHVPEGWGASTIMLKGLTDQSRNNGAVGPGFYTVVNPSDEQHLPYVLPYLAEKKRLRYGTVAVVPLFKDGRQILGAFLLFWSPGISIPDQHSREGRKLRHFLKPLCLGMSKITGKHNQLLQYPGKLEEHWSEVVARKTKTVRIAKIRLLPLSRNNGNRVVGDVEHAAREVLRALASPHCFAFRSREQYGRPATHSATILVAPCPDDTISGMGLAATDFKRHILGLLVDKFHDRPFACEVMFEIHGKTELVPFTLGGMSPRPWGELRPSQRKSLLRL